MVPIYLQLRGYAPQAESQMLDRENLIGILIFTVFFGVFGWAEIYSEHDPMLGRALIGTAGTIPSIMLAKFVSEQRWLKVIPKWCLVVCFMASVAMIFTEITTISWLGVLYMDLAFFFVFLITEFGDRKEKEV